MATDSFRFWDSYRDALKRCTPEQGYRLIMALCGAVFDGEEADFSDEPLLGMAYDVMLEQAIQSRDMSRAARESGKRGGRPKKGAERVAKGYEKGAESEKRRSEAKGNEASHSSGEESSAAAGARGALAGARPAAPPPDPMPLPPPPPMPMAFPPVRHERIR